MCGSVRKPLLLALASLLASSAAILAAARSLGAESPPVMNPFGPRPTQRQDATAGYVETSDGKVAVGMIYLTRDVRLKILDEKLQRQREVPLRVVKQIECKVKKEWMEKEWRFKELASDEKYYTGRKYPAREYLYTITLRDNRTITGPLSGIVYLKPNSEEPSQKAVGPARVKAQRFLIHKRDKGKAGTDLRSLIYVRLIKLGEEALEEGKRKAAKNRSQTERQGSQPIGATAPPNDGPLLLVDGLCERLHDL